MLLYIKKPDLIEDLYDLHLGTWDNTVGIGTSYGLVGPGLSPFMDRIFFSSPQHPNQLFSSPSLLPNGYWGLFPGGKAAG
jgi:hypothetical protein